MRNWVLKRAETLLILTNTKYDILFQSPFLGGNKLFILNAATNIVIQI